MGYQKILYILLILIILLLSHVNSLYEPSEPEQYVEVTFDYSSDLSKSCNNDGDCDVIEWPSKNPFHLNDDLIYFDHFICTPPFMDYINYVTQSQKQFDDPIPEGFKATKVCLFELIFRTNSITLFNFS